MSVTDSTRSIPSPVKVETGIYKGGGRHGYRVYVSEGGKGRWVVASTLDEARAVRRKVKAQRQLARAKGERITPPERRTLAEAVEAMLTTTRVSGTTRALYRHDLSRRELRPLMRRKIADVTTDDVARLVRELETSGNVRTDGPLAGATVRNVLTALSATFSLAVRRKWVAANPVAGLTKTERPSSRKRPHRVLDSDEIRRVLACAGERWRPLILLAVFAGLRQSELLGLTWSDVDLEAGRLLVRSQLQRGTKTRAVTKTAAGEREVPLPAFVVRALREHKLASRWSLDDDPVFASDTGTPLDHRNVGRAWERIRGETAPVTPGRGGRPSPGAGLASPLPVFHDLRHTAASLWIAEGLDVVWVSKVMGHASPSVTLDTYTDLFDRYRHDQRATAALDAAFAGLV